MRNVTSNLPQVRLLPSVMVCAAALLGLKLVSLSVGFDDAFFAVQPAFASATAEPDEHGAEAEEGHEGGDANGSSSDDAASSHGEEGAMEGGGDERGAASTSEPVVDPLLTPADFDTPSSAEQSVLRSLGDRRKELDARERDMKLQEHLLEASERRVQSRIDELKEIEARIEKLFGVQEEAQEQQLASLVTMYESMKPKDAARILSQLNMDVLLQVVKRMSERKMAPILAAMDPVAAQDLTVELVTGGQLPDGYDMSSVLNGSAAAP